MARAASRIIPARHLAAAAVKASLLASNLQLDIRLTRSYMRFNPRNAPVAVAKQPGTSGSIAECVCHILTEPLLDECSARFDMDTCNSTWPRRKEGPLQPWPRGERSLGSLFGSLAVLSRQAPVRCDQEDARGRGNHEQTGYLVIRPSSRAWFEQRKRCRKGFWREFHSVQRCSQSGLRKSQA